MMSPRLSSNWQIQWSNIPNNLEDRMNLREDLFSARHNNIIIDVGWYPEMDEDGIFIGYIVKNNNWEEALTNGERFECKTVIDIIHWIEETTQLLD